MRSYAVVTKIQCLYASIKCIIIKQEIQLVLGKYILKYFFFFIFYFQFTSFQIFLIRFSLNTSIYSYEKKKRSCSYDFMPSKHRVYQDLMCLALYNKVATIHAEILCVQLLLLLDGWLVLFLFILLGLEMLMKGRK